MPDSYTSRPVTPSTEAALLARARERFTRATVAETPNRALAVDDLKFKAGEQWPPDIKAQRDLERRPCITVNKMKTFVHQVTNSQRQNRPAINISPLGDKGDKRTADMLRGLIRELERNSDADVAYDTAFDNAVSNGFGYWRILTEYEREDSFEQTLRIRRVRNPFTVYLDPERQQPDGSDAKWGFVTELVSREEFKRDYPDADPVNWDLGAIGENYNYWCTADSIRVAEYFEIETRTRALVALANGHVGYRDELDETTLAKIKADPQFVLDQREADCRTVQWYKLTAGAVLDSREWPGAWIPIVEVVGDEIDVEGRVIKSGVIRDAKGPQRMYNFWATTKTEQYALQTKAPWIMAAGQDEGYEAEWSEANQKNFSRLHYRPKTVEGQVIGAPQRQPMPSVAGGLVEAQESAAQDMMATTGIRFDATKGERVSQESGIALSHLQSIGELGSFHYIDNLGRSLKHTGRILLDLIPKVMDTKRILTILGEDGKEDQVQIDPAQAKPYQRAPGANGKQIKSYNPKLGRFEVTINIGPSYQTKMAEATAGMMDFAKAFPNKADFVADLVAKNQQWPGSDTIATRLEMTLPPGMLQVDEQDLEPQVAAALRGQQQQLQQAQQQIQGLTTALAEKETQHQLAEKKIDADFEAAMSKIAMDATVKGLDHVTERMDMFYENMRALLEAQGKQETGESVPAQAPGAMPAAMPGSMTGAMPGAGAVQ